MSDERQVLGRPVGYDSPYDPALLCPIPRAPGREALGAPPAPHGWDVWNAWELSWLEPGGRPRIACGVFTLPADSPRLVESKSLKLYLNSFNQQVFADAGAVAATIEADLSACAGASVQVEIRAPAGWQWPERAEAGDCLDDLPFTTDRYQPAPELLRAEGPMVHRRCFSRLLRSRCPVTGQPDWGTLYIDYEGPEIDPAGLLGYIVSFREHQDFHEHCVERIFADLWRCCGPRELTVHARYLRRGGLDINPWRSTRPEPPAWARDFRQ